MSETSPPARDEAAATDRLVASHAALEAYLYEESKLSAQELDARDDRWAQENAREAVREEPW